MSSHFFSGKIELKLAFSEAVSPKVSYLENPYRIIFEFEAMSFKKLPLDFGQSLHHVNKIDFGQFSGGQKMVITFDRPYQLSSLESSNTALDGKTGMHVVFTKSDGDTFSNNAKNLGYHGNDLAFLAPIEDQSPGAKPLIMIDPGHGGNDPGAMRNGVSEKNVTLNAAQIIASILRQSNRYEVELTREGDEYVSLLDRRRMGENKGADLFLSFHADTVEETEVSGMTIYTLAAEASSQNASKFAQFENRVDMFGGKFIEADNADLSFVLAQMAQNQSMKISGDFSKIFQQKWVQNENNQTSPKLESAAFAVLKAPDVPSLLIELGFLSNEIDQNRIQDPKWLEDVGAKLLGTLDQIFYQTKN